MLGLLSGNQTWHWQNSHLYLHLLYKNHNLFWISENATVDYRKICVYIYIYIIIIYIYIHSYFNIDR